MMLTKHAFSQLNFDLGEWVAGDREILIGQRLSVLWFIVMSPLEFARLCSLSTN